MAEYKVGGKMVAIVSGPVKIVSSKVKSIVRSVNPSSKTFKGYFKSLETQGRSR